MVKKLTIVLATALITAACGVKADGPPAIEVDRSGCDHCRMLISDTRYAAAYRAEAAEPRVFDDIACMLAAAPTRSSNLRFWFQDADGSGWIEGQAATFVHSSKIHTPMSGGIAAYRSRAAAERAARVHDSRLQTLDELLAGREGRK